MKDSKELLMEQPSLCEYCREAGITEGMCAGGRCDCSECGAASEGITTTDWHNKHPEPSY